MVTPPTLWLLLFTMTKIGILMVVPTDHIPMVLIMVLTGQVLILVVPIGQALLLVLPTGQEVDRSIPTVTTLDTLLKSATSCMIILLVIDINPSLYIAIPLTTG